MIIIGRSAFAQTDTVTDRVRSLAGCYALHLGPWSGSLPKTGMPSAHTPPAHFRLDTIPIAGRRGCGFEVEPTNLVRSNRPLTNWRVTARDSLRVVWSTGFVGVSLRLIAHKDSLRGIATTFHDAHYSDEPPDPSAAALAVRERCPVQ